VCLVLTGCGDSGRPAAATDGAAAATTTPGTGESRAVELQAVLDGDSLEVIVAGRIEEVRMLGINTPERSECGSAEAAAAAERLVAGRRLEIAGEERDRFGRLLAYVLADGESVNLRLLQDGHAVAVDTEHDLREESLAAEEAAYRARSGIWAPDACGPPATARISVDAVVPDPPGRDEDPESGEHVRLRNDGDSSVDLVGWTVRDESSTHRFTFPTGTRLEPGQTVTVYSVCGAAVHCFGTETVWSNGGDTVLLLDPSGNVADRLRYPGD
jgi:endonuclease YncB( thermonuclease family)